MDPAHVFSLRTSFQWHSFPFYALYSIIPLVLQNAHSIPSWKCSFWHHIVLQQPPYFSAQQNVLKQKTTRSLMSPIPHLSSLFFKWEVCTWFYLSKFLKLYNSTPLSFLKIPLKKQGHLSCKGTETLDLSSCFFLISSNLFLYLFHFL